MRKACYSRTKELNLFRARIEARSVRYTHERRRRYAKDAASGARFKFRSGVVGGGKPRSMASRVIHKGPFITEKKVSVHQREMRA
jgi:hypothetical protein